MKKVLVINGANLNMLGIREPELYGKSDYKALKKYIEEEAAFLSAGVRGLNLGPYVLRLETAAVCGLAVLRQMMAGEGKR